MKHLADAAAYKSFLEGTDTFVFDCDGVIWRSNALIPDVARLLAALRKLGKRLVFVTNNSTKSRMQYRRKFVDLGIEAAPEEIYPSGFITCQYLKRTGFKGKVYVIGQEAIGEELDNVGIPWLGGRPQGAGNSMEVNSQIVVDPEVKAVVVGFDAHINYYKLAYAQQCLSLNPGCQFIATNDDATFPVGNLILPGGGTMVHALAYCSGKKPMVMGKPNTWIFQDIINEFKLDKQRTVMVGDRLETDILFGNAVGVRSLFVLTGVTSKEKLLSEENKIHPTYWLESAGLLAPVAEELAAKAGK